MNGESRRIRNIYLLLNLLVWFPTAFILGINTLFLLDGGLSNAQAFAANAFYTLGLLVFEIPTGVFADTMGRRASFLLGASTQLAGNLLYVYMWQIHGPFLGWIAASVILGFGYTFFSGALEAWMVDALKASKYEGDLDAIFAKGQIINGVAMLVGTITGGVIAQISSLGVPYLVRGGVQLLSFIVAFKLMRDVGFTPRRGASIVKDIRKLLRSSIKYGLGNPPVRWMMLAAPFYLGTGIFAFYAAQPYLLELFGDKTAIGIAGLAAALLASTQILGGLSVTFVRKIIPRRTTILLVGAIANCAALFLVGIMSNFYVVLALLAVWALAFAASGPVRQAYINALIPSQQRATVLSFDSMINSLGGVVFQPALGRVADVYSYAASFIATAGVAVVSLPFLWLARHASTENELR